MKQPLTLNETVPQVITGLKDLQQAVQNKSINDYQIGLVLTSLIYSLEHPEKHFSNGDIAY
jgi:hypothetical protein